MTETAPHRRDPGVASEATLDWRQWQDVPPAALDHPMRVVHALPRVTALDDFRSEFTVRGSALRHIGLVIDGVPAPWLQHSAGQGAKASLSMLTGHAIEEATLRAGAYPRRHGDRLGAELELTVREGSRDQFNLRGAVGDPTRPCSPKDRWEAQDVGHGSLPAVRVISSGPTKYRRTKTRRLDFLTEWPKSCTT